MGSRSRTLKTNLISIFALLVLIVGLGQACNLSFKCVQDYVRATDAMERNASVSSKK